MPIHSKLVSSLRSKRFRGFFHPFEAFFAFWRCQNWSERNTDGRSGVFLRSPQFSCMKKVKNASNLRKAQQKCLLRRLVSIQQSYWEEIIYCKSVFGNGRLVSKTTNIVSEACVFFYLQQWLVKMSVILHN